MDPRHLLLLLLPLPFRSFPKVRGILDLLIFVCNYPSSGARKTSGVRDLRFRCSPCFAACFVAEHGFLKEPVLRGIFVFISVSLYVCVCALFWEQQNEKWRRAPAQKGLKLNRQQKAKKRFASSWPVLFAFCCGDFYYVTGGVNEININQRGFFFFHLTLGKIIPRRGFYFRKIAATELPAAARVLASSALVFEAALWSQISSMKMYPSVQ